MNNQVDADLELPASLTQLNLSGKARVRWADELVEAYLYESKNPKFSLCNKIEGMALEAVIGPCHHKLIGSKEMFWMAKFVGDSRLALVRSKVFEKRFPGQVIEFFERRLQITDGHQLKARVLVDKKNNPALVLVKSGLLKLDCL